MSEKLKTCISRIPANGDSDVCGKLVLRGDYCRECLTEVFIQAGMRLSRNLGETLDLSKYVVDLCEPEDRETLVRAIEVSLDNIREAIKRV